MSVSQRVAQKKVCHWSAAQNTSHGANKNTRWKEPCKSEKVHKSCSNLKNLPPYKSTHRVFPKIGVSQNGWWKSWKTLLIHGWFGGKTQYFRKHPHLFETKSRHSTQKPRIFRGVAWQHSNATSFFTCFYLCVSFFSIVKPEYPPTTKKERATSLKKTVHQHSGGMIKNHVPSKIVIKYVKISQMVGFDGDTPMEQQSIKYHLKT